MLKSQNIIHGDLKPDNIVVPMYSLVLAFFLLLVLTPFCLSGISRNGGVAQSIMIDFGIAMHVREGVNYDNMIQV